MFLSSENGMSGTFVSCIKGFKYCFTFQTERGISLEMLPQERASSFNDRGTSWFFSSFGGILDLRLGTQEASRVAPGKSNLHSSCEGEVGIALESMQCK